MDSSLQRIASDWVARRDAGLSPSEAKEFDSWLAADPRHREAMERCDSAWSALDRPHLAGAADELLEAIALRVRRKRRTRVAMAAGFAVVLCAAFLLPRARVDSPAPSTTALVILPKEQKLPDGTLVQLNAGAEISIAFEAKVRRVFLSRGEAHFQVTKSVSRPFVVSVGGIEVRAVGTAFSVGRTPDQVEVLVTEGKVAVDKIATAVGSRSPAPSGVIATLEAGCRTVVDLAPTASSPHVEAMTASEISERLAWRAPKLEFTGTPLSEAIALLNEQAIKAAAVGYEAPRYAIADPSIESLRISGLFRVDNTESFVRLLENGFGIAAESRDGKVFFHRAP